MAPLGSQHPPDRRAAAVVFVGIAATVTLFLALKYEPYSFLARDASFYATITRGLVEDFSLDQRRWQPESWYTGTHPRYRNLDMSWSNVSVGADGTWYPKHSYLMPMLATPFYAAFGSSGLLIFNGLCSVLMLFCGYLIAQRYAGAAAAALAVAIVMTSTGFERHTYQFSLDTFTAALVGLACVSLLKPRLITAGILIGLALWSRPNYIILIAPVTFALLWKRVTLKQLIPLGIATAVPLAIYAIANWVMFGKPWTMAYDRILVVENGVPEIQTARDKFELPPGKGLQRMFFDGYHGIWHQLPAAFVAVPGLASLWRRGRLLSATLLVVVLAYVLFFYSYEDSNARFFLAWMVLLITPLAALFADVGALIGRFGETAAKVLRPPERAQKVRIIRIAAIVAGVLVVGLLIGRSATSGGPYVLSEHIEDATVHRGELICDYYNMRHLKWECPVVPGRGSELTGQALGKKQCVFKKQPLPMIVTHPAPKKVVKRITYRDLPPGDLDLTFGLADRSRGPACFQVTYGAGKERLCAKKAGQLQTVRFVGSSNGEPGTLELAIEGGPAKRHLCVDGVIEAGD